MNNRTSLFICILLFCSALLNAQDITMDLGGQHHSGVYNTEPQREYAKTNWTSELKGKGNANLILKDSILYVSSMLGTYSDASRSGCIYAIDCRDGHIIWQRNLNQSISAPILKDTILYCGSDEKEGKMRAFNKKDGKLIWEFSLEVASCWAPAVIDDKAFFGDHYGNWFVVNNTTGELLFKENISAGICCVPSIVDSMVFYIDLKGALHLVDANTFADL